jgi:hypothetical protein
MLVVEEAVTGRPAGFAFFMMRRATHHSRIGFVVAQLNTGRTTVYG